MNKYREMCDKSAAARLEGYATGGAVRGRAKTNVNVIIQPSAPAAAPAPTPVPIPIPAPGAGAPPAMPPKPPMMPPGGMGGAPLAGGLGGASTPPMRTGGRVFARGEKVSMKVGSDSGEGRLKKAAAAKRSGKDGRK